MKRTSRSLEVGQDRGEVALALERGAGGRAEPDAELLADDVGEARLAEPGRADQQHVVERLAARARRLERDRELLLDPLLADELVEPRAAAASARARPRRGCDRRRQELRLVRVMPPSAPGARAPRAELRIGAGERLLGLGQRQPSSTSASRATACGLPAIGVGSSIVAELLLQLEHDALRGLLADPGDRLEAGGVLERDRAAQVGRRTSRRRSRARPSGRRRRRRAGARTARARPARRSRRAGARPRARAGRSRARPRPRARPARSAVGVTASA